MKKILLPLLLACLAMAGAMPAAGEDVLSSYTYIPGEKILVYEDLSTTPVGDIPTGALIVNGETETVLIGGEKWLKLGSGAQLIFEIPPDAQDLTLEFYLRGRGDTGFRMSLENPEKEYDAFIDAGNLGGHWEGGYKGKDLPSSSTAKEFYGDDQAIQFAITLQKDRVKLYINKMLMMNTAGFTPVMPGRITLGFSETEFCAVKDIRLATLVPDIAREILSKGKYVSHGVYFDTGSAKVKQESHYVLRRIADVLRDNPTLKLLVVGHTDNVGDKAKNEKLSLDRANSVKSYLISVFGADGARLQTAGKGDREPIADNKTPDGRALNRRVEFIKTG